MFEIIISKKSEPDLLVSRGIIKLHIPLAMPRNLLVHALTIIAKNNLSDRMGAIIAASFKIVALQ
jgi:hypothetical protein